MCRSVHCEPILAMVVIKDLQDCFRASSPQTWAEIAVYWIAQHPGVSMLRTRLAFMDSCQARVAHSKHSVFPVPVGLSRRAFFPCTII